MEDRRGTGRIRATVYAVIVVAAGIGGMIGYGLLVGKPVTRWPVSDALVMVGTTLVTASLVHMVTERLLGHDAHRAEA